MWKLRGILRSPLFFGSTKPPFIIISKRYSVILNQKQTESLVPEKSKMLFTSKNLFKQITEATMAYFGAW